MAGLLGTGGGQKKYKLMLVTPSSREYMVTLTSLGPFNDEPPMVAWELDDGAIEAGERTYSSLDHLASEHGCVISEVESVEPTN